MARPRPTPPLDPGTDDEPTLQDTGSARDDYRGRDNTSDGEPTDRLTELLEQYSPESGYRVYVERLDPLNGPEYLGMVPFDEQLLDCVRIKWGGGRFGGKIVDNRSKYVARVPPFRIGGRAIEPTTDAAPAAAAPSNAGNESHIAAIIATSLAGFRDAIIDAVRPQPQPPAVDPLQQLQSLASVIKDLQPPPQPQSSFDPQSMFETMTSMLDLRDRIRGSGDGGSGVGEAIREFAPLLRGVLDREAAPPPPQDQQPPADTVKLPRASTPKPAAAWLQPFMRWKSLLLSYADQGKDPALYSDVLVDNLSDEQATAIATADVPGGQLEIDLFTAVPELNHSDKRRVFAGKLLAELRHGLYGESGAPAKKKKTRAPKPVATAAGGAA